MNFQPYVLASPPTPSGQRLRVVAKRYRPKGRTPQDGITLLMFHGLGQHKEQWEPVLEKVFTLQAEKSNFHHIREAWLFDWQSHGESAILNEQALKCDPKSAPLDLWGYAVAGFLKSGLVNDHRLVGVGYSFGNIALLLSTHDFDKCPYDGIILVEPSMTDEETYNTHRDDIQAAFDMVTNAVNHRRNIWESKEAAHQFFMSRYPWTSWDSRMVALFAEHALKDSMDQDGKPCIVRRCPVIHEASAFQVNLGPSDTACEQLSKLSRTVPIHVVFGETVDLSPQVIRNCAVDRTKGRNVASVTMVPDVGHTIIQDLPDVVATTVSNLLDNIYSSQVRSFL
ncbi:Alpha/beta hydrolase fold-1 [Mycena capillaripes]|nr:Alpha/beta hydrolase fold-1 [Mycena capillaripes]